MIYIIGAGISGLSVADNLKRDFKIFEKSDHIGGISTQYNSGGYWFDFSGHYFHFQKKEDVKKYVKRFSHLKKYRRDSRIFIFDKFVPYPVQYHLSHFPEKISKKIFEEITSGDLGVRINLADSLRSNFGDTLYEMFFRPFLTKYYRRDPANIIPEMDKGSIPVPDRKSVEEGLAGKDFSEKGYNADFYYPSRGLRVFIDKMGKKVAHNINYNEEVCKINIYDHLITTNKREYKYSEIVNTMPLRNLARCLDPSPEWMEYSTLLESVSTIVVNVILNKKKHGFHWVYLPNESSDFYRAGYYPNHPATACYLERSIENNEYFDYDEIRKSAVSLMKKMEMIDDESDVIHLDILKIPDSYIIFNKEWNKTVPRMLGMLSKNNIYSIGRYGSWNYSSMSEDIKNGILTADILNGK